MSDSRHSTKTGVTVFTWGSQDNSPLKHQYLYETANHFYQTQFFSRNPGHAAILLTLPDNIANRAQVESELAGTNIPYQFKKYQTNKINYKTPHSLNQNTESDIPAFAASVIEVYFSFWPSHEAAASFSTYEADLKDERRGIPVTFNQKRMHELNPQLKPEVSPRKKRPMSRFFTEEKDEITLGFHSYYHPIHNKPELNKLMSIYQQKQLDAEKINSIKIISNKLQALKDLMSKNKAPSQPIFMPALLESQITQYIDEHACQEIKPFIKSKGLVTVDELNQSQDSQ